MRQPEVDAVYVLTPNRFHAEHAIMAAESGMQVFADKPMALSLDDCDRMIAVAERNGVRLLVGHTQSLDPGIRAMADIVRSGELGAPVMFHTWYFNDWLYRPRDRWSLIRALGKASYFARRLSRWTSCACWAAKVRSVKAHTRVADLARPVVGACTTFLEMDDDPGADGL